MSDNLLLDRPEQSIDPLVRSLRLVAQDVALSRRKHRFESGRERQTSASSSEATSSALPAEADTGFGLLHSRDNVSAILNVAPPPGVSSTQMRPP
jgi:hypothetical protein